MAWITDFRHAAPSTPKLAGPDTGLLPAGKFDNVPGYTSKEAEVASHDGVKVPLSIIYPEDIALDGSEVEVRGDPETAANRQPANAL